MQRYPVQTMRKDYRDLETIVHNPQKMKLIESFFRDVFNQETEPASRVGDGWFFLFVHFVLN